MSCGIIKLRVSKDAIKELFSSRKISVSKGIDEVLDKYSEKVEVDVLKEFLEDRR